MEWILTGSFTVKHKAPELQSPEPLFWRNVMSKELTKFEKSIKGLQACTSAVTFPHISLPHDCPSRLACIWDESFPSRAAAERDAERRLRELYQTAVEQMNAYLDMQAPNSIFVSFQSRLNKRLTELRELLAACRTERSAPVVAQLQELLTSDHICQELQEIHRGLGQKYFLKKERGYAAQIEYGKHDPSVFEEGLAWLVAKAFCRYGYDLFPVILNMEEDATKQLKAYQAALHAQAALLIDKHIITPVQKKLPILRVLLRDSGAERQS